MTDSLANAFARGVAAKDQMALRGLLHPEIDFRGMTPGKVWEADDAEDVLVVIATWFDDNDVIESVEEIFTTAFADRQHCSYRFRIRNANGLHLVEQQVYISETGGQIGWLRIMCSGFRPID